MQLILLMVTEYMHGGYSSVRCIYRPYAQEQYYLSADERGYCIGKV